MISARVTKNYVYVLHGVELNCSRRTQFKETKRRRKRTHYNNYTIAGESQLSKEHFYLNKP